ncbi:hypothetical protein CARUB_v10006519mg [Capsella rubella]|uniref:Protein CLP1 homolog n=1 Tax=Capsella rubella TaxID=81985 RepID=R0F857_9BRAS|nr:hypothetical protein CARUB_v10006519mg [Capsella rubella]
MSFLLFAAKRRRFFFRCQTTSFLLLAKTTSFLPAKTTPFLLLIKRSRFVSRPNDFGPQIRQVKLKKQSELRIKVQRTSQPLRLRLLDGKAEIFGYELPHEVWLTFPPLMIFAVFTWYGAIIEIDGIAETKCTSCETPMMSYLRVHNSLQVERHRSTSSTRDCVPSQGPRVIIVGDTDSGKTTLAKMLLNWAAKDGWKPTYVDLNIGQSSTITIPGTVSATPVEMPVDPVEGFPLDKAIVHYFGHTSPSINLRLYLKKDLKFKKNLQFLNLEMSAGVFTRSSHFRKTLRNYSIQNYFYGVTNDLTVYTKILKFSDVHVYRIGDFPESGSSTSAQRRGNNPLKITHVTIDEHLVNKVLSISYAKQDDQIISSVVAGFVCIKNVDIGEERITYISPSAAELPSKILILGTLTWHVT